MAAFRFGISKTEHEWETLRRSINGKSLSGFLNREINRIFRSRNTSCPTSRIERVRKEFTLDVDDQVFENVLCEANYKGITPGELIAQKIIDAHLTAPSTASERLQ